MANSDMDAARQIEGARTVLAAQGIEPDVIERAIAAELEAERLVADIGARFDNAEMQCIGLRLVAHSLARAAHRKPAPLADALSFFLPRCLQSIADFAQTSYAALARKGGSRG